MIEDQNLLKAIGAKITMNIKRRIIDNKIKPSTPDKQKRKATLTDSGNLLNSIKYVIRDNTIVVGTNVKYARIHHEGGTIVPKKAKYLAIPLTPAAKVKKPLDWEDTFISKGIIFRKLGKGKIEALYKLQKSVKIPARPYMFIDSADQSQISNLITSYYDKKIRSKFNGS
jgi:phage gpG-like protein